MQTFKENFPWYFLGVLVLSVGFIWAVVLKESTEGVVTVSFLDVGQGDSIFIETPNGNQMLIDGGGDKKVLRQLASVMPFYDRSIDVVLATHPDKDHIGGLPAVLEHYAVSFFVEPGVKADTGTYATLDRYLNAEAIKRVYARRGMVLNLGEGARFEILFPDRDVPSVAVNSASIIGKFTYGDTAFLFSGDAPTAIEEYVVSLDGERLDVDVLKVGHHGSKTSTAPSFIGMASPSYAVISAGSDNRYGHPHKEVIATLNRFEAIILGTYQKGTLVFESDGKTVRLR